MTTPPDLLAAASTRFPLAGSTFSTSGADLPSPQGLRPWCLHHVRPAGPGRVPLNPGRRGPDLSHSSAPTGPTNRDQGDSRPSGEDVRPQRLALRRASRTGVGAAIGRIILRHRQRRIAVRVERVSLSEWLEYRRAVRRARRCVR